MVADLATWSLNFSSTGNELAAAQRELGQNLEKTRTFLQGFGIRADEIEMQSISVNDAWANAYGSDVQGRPRYTVSGGLTVRTTSLQGALEAKNGLGKLIGSGVVLTSSYGPNFAFTQLNDKKLELVSRATAEAKKAAVQFAKDSGSRLGGIRRARQGSVEILGRDSFVAESEQINKVLRVVTTVDYDVR
ncbi:MAG: SIMPL domain-containing protein [Proteobacteria bacterium]|nr:SIMPL domain-containing protein [Pseudomonadota bacterium]